MTLIARRCGRNPRSGPWRGRIRWSRLMPSGGEASLKLSQGECCAHYLASDAGPMLRHNVVQAALRRFRSRTR